MLRGGAGPQDRESALQCEQLCMLLVVVVSAAVNNILCRLLSLLDYPLVRKKLAQEGGSDRKIAAQIMVSTQ